MTRALTGSGTGIGWRRRWLGCLLVIGLLAPAAASAAALTEPDARAVRQVVEAQLDAFAADNAGLAFSYASAALQAQFGTATRFMAMVRGAYPMVVRPAAVSFFQAQAQAGTDGVVSQPVQLRDHEGRLWLATYLLERRAGDGWRISACVVAADSGKSLT